MGGDERGISVFNGLSKLDVNNRDFVMVHDGKTLCTYLIFCSWLMPLKIMTLVDFYSPYLSR